MSEMLGADPDQLDQLATRMQQSAQLLDTVQATIGGSLVRVEWFGVEADRVRLDWRAIHTPALLNMAGTMRELAGSLQHSAALQRVASSAAGIPSGFGGGGAGAGSGSGAGGAPPDLGWIKDLKTGLGGGIGVLKWVLNSTWDKEIGPFVSNVARYVAGGGKGVSLRLISELEDLTAGKAAGLERDLEALAGAGNVSRWAGPLSRIPGMLEQLDRVSTGLAILGGPLTTFVDLMEGKGLVQSVAQGGGSLGVGLLLRFGSSTLGLGKIGEGWLIANGVTYIIANIGSPAVHAGFEEWLHDPGQAAHDTWQGITDGQVGAGVLNALSGGIIPDDPNQIRSDLHNAIDPTPPPDFTPMENIAAQAALKYTGSGWNAVPLVGGAFTSSSAAQQALYQQVLSDNMVKMVQEHDVAGLQRLVQWIGQQPYGNSDVERPYQMVEWALQHSSSATGSTQQAQQFIVQALGQGEMRNVVQGMMP